MKRWEERKSVRCFNTDFFCEVKEGGVVYGVVSVTGLCC